MVSKISYLGAALRRGGWMCIWLVGCARDPVASSHGHPQLAHGLAATLRPCRQGMAIFAGTGLLDREKWYGSQLRAAGEGPLCTDSTNVPETYRLTWIPSFHPTVVVRLEFGDSGVQLVGKILTGAGGYEPGALGKQVKDRLSDADLARFSEFLRSARFWELQTKLPTRCCDSSTATTPCRTATSCRRA